MEVGTVACSLPGCDEAGGGALAERPRPIVGAAELCAVVVGLFEVVAEDLVALDELGVVVFEPVGEALVQLGPGCLGERVVGGVADQDVAEAERVLAGERGPVGPDQLLAHQRGQPRGHLLLGRGEGLDGAAVEELALDRAALEHAPVGSLELVEPGGKKRPQRRWHDDLVAGAGRHRDHLGHEQRVAAGGACDPLAQLGRKIRGQ